LLRDDIGQRCERVDFVTGLVEALLQRLRVLLRLNGILRRDERAHGPFGEIVDRWVEQQRGHQERAKQRKDPCRDRRVAIPHDDSGG
jgi:hypothetical protein